MVMPLPLSHLRPASPSSALKNDVPQARSPFKQHLKDAAMVGAKASIESTSTGIIKHKTLVPGNFETCRRSESRTQSGQMRAAMLQAVLGLMDRGDEELQQLLPLLHLLGSLPLDSDRVRRECSQALRRIHAAHGHGTAGLHRMPHARSSTLPRDSGRAKSSISLRHCKEFLLACANEIHELEEVNPNFDYVEETSSDVTATRPSTPSHTRQARASSTTRHGHTFDYASTVDSSSAHTARPHFDYESVDDEVDTYADQGSQLSELLCRTVEAEREDTEMFARDQRLSLPDRITCRRAFHAWRIGTPPARLARKGETRELALLFRAFSALKRHRAASQVNWQRKQHAFGRMRTLVIRTKSSRIVDQKTRFDSRHSPLRTPIKSSMRTKLQRMIFMHLDLVLLLVVAGIIQTIGV